METWAAFASKVLQVVVKIAQRYNYWTT